ncbi:DUF6044 family protein [Caldibacillus lycopersici]|uniref:DUF6044 family protein n=1 Tax=Perspicuibacillus lycopersici TaxID=1325689 RepID=A0AAE3LMA6_9BACI|nr:DUF6044 family protein [Perspicuibacillus lycopersici]MCU9613375.1 DUF6044 family protein [Perspicuibacillus lycopersici]
MSVENNRNERAYFLVALLLILIFVSPLFLFGENAHLRVHDNLDSNIAWYRVLVRSGELFGNADTVIPQVINGLPRYSYGSEWSGIVWLHAIFPPMLAYTLSQTITRVFAFIGMYLFLREFLVKDDHASVIRIGVSVAFALTPFWPSGMLSTLGQPLALWAFLKIRAGRASLREWLTIGLLPFYASIVLGFFYFLAAISFLWLYDLIFKGRWNLRFISSIALMTILFLLVEYRLVFATFFLEEVSHRVEFISSRHELIRSLKLSIKNFVLGHNHVMTVHTIIILPLYFLVLGLIIYRREWKKERLFILLLIVNYLLSLWYALWFNVLWIPLKERISFLNTFNFARFHFLRPLIIYSSFAIGSYYLWRIGWRKLTYGIIIAQIMILLPFNEEIHYRFIHHSPTFKQFYAEEQFNEIAQFIKQPKSSYRVASIGIHPAIAQYNGFYTLDTYNNFYPLTYKYKFRKIIENELAKNHKLKTYFDEWGSRCYIFVDELGKKYDYQKNAKKVINHLQLNSDAFYDLGGRYIFSGVPIGNAEENQLQLLKIFEHRDSAWKIYLYKVINT